METVTFDITQDIIDQATKNRATGKMPNGDVYSPCFGCVTSLAGEIAMGFPVAMGISVWGPRRNSQKYRVPPELKIIQTAFDNGRTVTPTKITFELVERE